MSNEVMNPNDVIQVLHEAIKTFYACQTVDDSIQGLLSIAMDYYQSRRAYIIEFNEAKNTLTNSYEVFDSNSSSQKEEISHMKLDFFKLMLKDVLTSDEIITEIALFKESNPGLYKFFTAKGIEKLKAVPLRMGDRVFGVLGLENPSKSIDDFTILDVISIFVELNISRRDETTFHVVNAISRTYSGMYMVNLKEDTFRVFNSTQTANQFLNMEMKDAANQMRNVMTSTTKPESLKEILRFSDLTTVSDRLKGQTMISTEFKGIQKGWCRASFIPVSTDSTGKVDHVLYIIQEIDEEKKKEIEYENALKKALENQNEVYAEILQMQSVGIIAINIDKFRIITINEAAANIFGVDKTKINADSFKDFLAMCEFNDGPVVLKNFMSLKTSGGQLSFEFSLGDENNKKYVLANCRLATIKGSKKIILMTLTDISENKEMEKRLLRMSEIDSLTQILNRGAGEKEIDKLLRYDNKGIFCLLDVDKFKLINDTYGHVVGDEVLINIAECLKKAFRKSDIIMRLGGDEFAVFAPGIDNENTGKEGIKRFFEFVEEISIPQLKDKGICVSLGAVMCNMCNNINFDELYQKSDKAMYQAKNLPGNQFVFYKEGMSTSSL